MTRKPIIDTKSYDLLPKVAQNKKKYIMNSCTTKNKKIINRTKISLVAARKNYKKFCSKNYDEFFRFKSLLM